MALGPAEVAHGPMLIGTFLALVLFGISVTQVYMYWSAYRKKDRLFIQGYVVLVFITDTVHTVFIMAYMYLSLVKHFGDIAYISDSTWVFAAEPALVGIIGGLVQSFYGWRVQILLKNWFVTIIIFIGALANMRERVPVTTCRPADLPNPGSFVVMGIATAIGADIVKAFSEFQRFQVVVIIWAVTAMAADLIIMATLVLHLRHFKTGFNKGTDNQIDRIIRLTLQTGMITVIWDIAHLLTFLLDPAGVHLFFNFTLAKLYTNSILSSLNSRGGWKFMDSTTDNATVTNRSGIYTEHGVSQHVEVNLGHHTRSRPEVFIQVESHEMMDQNQKSAAIDY
ncbi:hypothetical protein EV361DRAFT_999535 [Lentinula raphanica]|nr:hypothetical protein FB446DRAFT_794370 [Lentinula raphanica]KAJ3823313.1 hypothetical protein F5880DRAFT_1612984 [Lentinula raphanica]KAJ3969358.1 hypothetical protein EV361DRAFT_999535 [Lentinula raphanica]